MPEIAAPPIETVTPPAPAAVVIPQHPSFSPKAVEAVLGAPHGTVMYWLNAGKLESYRDLIGERYVLRAELIRFVIEYLKRPCED